MLQCPACNKLNPADHQFCGYCGSRLPAAPPTDDTLPPWLADDTNVTQVIETEQASRAAAGNEHADDHAVPAWLRDPHPVSNVTQPTMQHASHDAAPSSTQQHGTSDNETAPDLPFWLNEASTTVAAPTDRTPGAPQQGIDQPAAASDAQDAVAADGDALSAWLDAQAASPTGAPVGSEGQAAAAEPATTTTSDDALPPWLFAVDAPPSDGGTTPALGTPVPSATNESHGAAASNPAPARNESLSWLEDVQAAPTPPTAPAANSADQLPAWLRDDLHTPAPQQNDASFAAQDLPAWLRDDSSSATSPSSTAAPDVAAAWQPEQQGSVPVAQGSQVDSLPAWLRDDAATFTAEQPAQPNGQAPHEHGAEQFGTAPTTNESLPEWLRDEPSGSANDVSAAPPADEASMPNEQDSLPAWLLNTTSAPPIDVPSDAVPTELPTGESEQEAPVGAARVYDAVDAQEMPSATAATTAPEPEITVTPAVYDAPPSAEPSEEQIAALLATPVAASEAAPVPSTSAVVPVAVPQPAPPAAQPDTPPQSRPTPVVPPQAAQRSNGLWIMLAVVLMIAVLAVIWLALRLNNLI